MINIDDEVMQAVFKHAKEDYPKEACGVVLSVDGLQMYAPCRNTAKGNDQFAIHPHDLASAEDLGEIVCVYHSHPDHNAQPSMADRVSCELHGYPWLIVSHPDGDVHLFEPCGYKAPLLGREFFHGILDCWAACRDWYDRELGIEFPNYERTDAWWETETQSMYEKNYKEAGFVKVDFNHNSNALQYGDMLVLRIGRTLCANHAAIYLGSNSQFKSEEVEPLGGQGPFMFHHMYGHNSERIVYGGNWLERTVMVLRPEELA